MSDDDRPYRTRGRRPRARRRIRPRRAQRRGAARGRRRAWPSEPSFAREVADWEERLGGMASYVTPVTPPAQTWLRIEAALGAPPPPPRRRRATMWQSLAFWRGLRHRLVGAGGRLRRRAGLCRHAADAARRPRAPLLATLTGTQDQAAEFRRRHRRRRHEPHHRAGGAAHRRQALDGTVADPAGRQAGVARPDRGRPAGADQRAAELLEQVGSGATLAVSLEPLGGSPTGQPTGEVIAHGNLTRL